MFWSCLGAKKTVAVSLVAVLYQVHPHTNTRQGLARSGHQCSCITVCHNMRIAQLTEVFVIPCCSAGPKKELVLIYKQTSGMNRATHLNFYLICSFLLLE